MHFHPIYKKYCCSVQQKDGKTLPNTAKSMEEKITEGNTYCSRGNVYLMRGDFKNAKECYEHCLTITKEVGNRTAEGNCLRLSWQRLPMY